MTKPNAGLTGAQQHLMGRSFARVNLSDCLVYQLDRALPMTALVRSSPFQMGARFAQMLNRRLHMGLPGIGRK